MDYDYSLFKTYIINLLKKNYPADNKKIIGDNISIMPNVKIVYDGHGISIEEVDGVRQYVQQGDKNREAYAIYVHKDALKKDWVFPEHEKGVWDGHPEWAPDWYYIRRPDVEVCLYAWYNISEDSWDVRTLEERLEIDNQLNEDVVMTVLEGLNKQ